MRKLLTEGEKREKARLKSRRRMSDPIKRAKHYAARNAARRKRWAEKVAAEGKTVRKWRYTAEEKKAADYANTMRWRNKDIEAFRAWDRENKRKIRATEEGAEKHVKSVARSLKKNKHKYVERFKVHARTRRAKVLGAAGKHTAADIADLLRKQKGKCAWCLLSLGEDKYHVDHYVPLVLGGSNDKSNLRLLHARCNLRKNRKHPADFAQQNGLLCW